MDLLVPIKNQSKIQVRVDNATGFTPLVNNKDPELEKLDIQIIQTDPFNKNANAVVDNSCKELETVLKHIEPDGRPVSAATLQHAVGLLNSKLRRGGKLSAMEIHFNRNMHTGEQLALNYQEIRKDQLKTRDYHNEKHNLMAREADIQEKDPEPGDLVAVKIKPNKHIA